jgi:tRNA (cmo5U34)-methyltransferase
MDVPEWSESDSADFVQLSDVIVPARSEQIETLCQLVPAGSQEVFALVELGAGDGLLARTLLERFPKCRCIAFERSQVMKDRLRVRLAPFEKRVTIRHFDLVQTRWRANLPHPLRCVVSSLVVHHLPGAEKRRLFADMAAQLEPGGALLLSDIVEPPTPYAARLFAKQWDQLAQKQSQKVTGGLGAYETFKQDGWNYYEQNAPDEMDQPSRLIDQLRWLEEAGLNSVDCYWMRAGHAIFGGYR